MIASGAASSPIPSRPVRIRSMYDDISGRTYALTTVVARPLVLALLAQDLARERDRRLRQLLGEDRARRAARARDRDRSGGSRRRRSRSRARAAALPAARTSASSSGSTTVPSAAIRSVTSKRSRRSTSGGGLRQKRSYMCGIREPPQLEHVAEVAGRHEGRLGAEPLQDGVRRDGRAVHHLGDAAVRRGRPREPGDRLDDGAVVARRRREELVHADAPVGLVEDHVGERAADVDADPRRRAHLRFAIANCISGRA